VVLKRVIAKKKALAFLLIGPRELTQDDILFCFVAKMKHIIFNQNHTMEFVWSPTT
jgi:hypothetical protein